MHADSGHICEDTTECQRQGSRYEEIQHTSIAREISLLSSKFPASLATSAGVLNSCNLRRMFHHNPIIKLEMAVFV